MKRSELLAMIDRCLELCEEEKAAGYPGEATRDQVEGCVIPDLRSFRKKVVAGDDFPKDPVDRWLASFANAFKAWNWNMNDPTKLYIALTRLHNAYRTYGGDLED